MSLKEEKPTNVTNTKGPRLPFVDETSQLKFIKYVRSLGEKPATTVRFFEHTDCYSVHGKDDTDLIARILFKSTAFITEMTPAGASASTLPTLLLWKSKFENAARELLLVRNFRVEIFVQGEKTNADDGDDDWHLEYRGSPGNLLQFEDILFSTNKEFLMNSNIISLELRVNNNQRKIGLASVEPNDYLFQLMEFMDDDFYTELEALIVLLSPKECLLPSKEGQYDSLRNVLERNNVLVSIVTKSSAFSDKSSLMQDLNRLLYFDDGQQQDASDLPELKSQLSLTALGNAIRYLKLVDETSNLGHFQVKQLNMDRFVHLDAAAVNALNILPANNNSVHSTMGGGQSFARFHSILGVLDHCRTPQGHRLMNKWIIQPLRNQKILNDRHDIVECLLENIEILDTLHNDYLKRIPDILMLSKKLRRNRANLQDVFRLYQVVIRVPNILDLLSELNNSTVQGILIDPCKSLLCDLDGLRQMMETVMDFKALETGEYLVKAELDDELRQNKERVDKLLHRMEQLREKATRNLNLDRNQLLRLENVARHGYHFRITCKDEVVLRDNKKYRILDVVKSGVRFTNDELTECSEKFSLLRERYEEQQRSIVDEIVKIAIGYTNPLTALNGELAQLDCLVSFAVAARQAPLPYVRPKILEEGSGQLLLKDVRHPCLELQEHVSYIANSVEFHKDECNMMIITGPNMGGKSTYIRSVGVAVLMAHVGSFVPCTKATISMVDCILGRVGASDNIVKGLSTFMVEMIETAGIIRTATEKSLVIVDELGRGTSTYEGCGIAWSIAEHLAKEAKCFALFATHFHEITQMAESIGTVRNYHMAAIADANNFTLLFQVRPGVMTKSFGIQVAQLANFPTNVIKDAQRVYDEFQDDDDKNCKDISNDKLNKDIDAALCELREHKNPGEEAVNHLIQLIQQYSLH